MAFHLHGIHVPHRKNTANKPVIHATPKTVTIPMAMHIGAPAVPAVKVGDTVKVGTKIGEAEGYVSSCIHSSVSGKVTKITEHLLSNGTYTNAVIIESDSEMTVDETITPPVINNKQDMVDALKASGIVGLGGAGFPTSVKFDVDPEKIDYLIINCAECEPYITSDTVTLMTRGDDMADAIKALSASHSIKKVIIGIENNKKQAIANMKKMADSIAECSVEVKVLPSVYPQGGEKVLVYHTTGRKIPSGKLPIDVGCIVINCTTLAAIGSFVRTGMPLTEKCVTVDGSAVKNPQNVIAPIGTAISDLFECCDGLTEEPEKLIYGGPMMGITVPDASAPVLKNTNAVLALTKKEAKLPETTPCIRCGACVNTCPFGLAPATISKAYERKDIETLEALNPFACMECGCCSYVCPANRPLVHNNKLAKQLLKESKSKEV